MSASRVESSDPEALQQLDLVSTFVYVNYINDEPVLGESYSQGCAVMLCRENTQQGLGAA